MSRSKQSHPGPPLAVWDEPSSYSTRPFTLRRPSHRGTMRMGWLEKGSIPQRRGRIERDGHLSNLWDPVELPSPLWASAATSKCGTGTKAKGGGGGGGAELLLTSVPGGSGPLSEASGSCQEVVSQGCPADLGSVPHPQGLQARSPREGPLGTRHAASP